MIGAIMSIGLVKWLIKNYISCHFELSDKLVDFMFCNKINFTTFEYNKIHVNAITNAKTCKTEKYESFTQFSANPAVKDFINIYQFYEWTFIMACLFHSQCIFMQLIMNNTWTKLSMKAYSNSSLLFLYHY